MVLTLAEVARRAPEGDPIDGEMTWDANGDLNFAGVDDGTCYRDSLNLHQDGDCVSLRWRSPNERDWQGPVLFDNFDELHTWVYEL